MSDTTPAVDEESAAIPKSERGRFMTIGVITKVTA